MYPLNPYLIEKIVRRRQEELEREAALNRLVRECKGDAKGVNASSVKHRLLVIIAVLTALVWFLG